MIDVQFSTSIGREDEDKMKNLDISKTPIKKEAEIVYANDNSNTIAIRNS